MVLFVLVLALVVGILSVSGAKFQSSGGLNQTFSPRWVQASAVNTSISLDITNDATSPAAIKAIDITRPGGISNFECGAAVPSGWACSKNSATVVRFTNSDGLAAGSFATFTVNITPPATGGNYSFAIDTFENTGATVNINSSNANVSVDSYLPTIRLLNISTSVKNISELANFDPRLGIDIFINNASAGIVIAVQALDNGSGVSNVTLMYNSTRGINELGPGSLSFSNATLWGNVTSVVPMANSSADPGIFTYTINTTNFTNGSKVFFSLMVNDTVGNGNVSNKTALGNWNFTIDAAAPVVGRLNLTNISSVSTNAFNTTSVLGGSAAVEYILNASVSLNITVNATDDGGSGVIRAEIMNRTGHFASMNLFAGVNGSSSTSWAVVNNTNITLIGQRAGGYNGDGVYNITFRFTDNVSNVLITNFSVEVDDTPPTGIVLGAFNRTIDGKTSQLVNVTYNSNPNETFIVSLQTTSNINNQTANISVKGNLGLVFNLSFDGNNYSKAPYAGSVSGSSTWNLTIQNGTLSNLSNFCSLTNDTDGQQCNLQFSFQDVLGRVNNSLNYTLYVDLRAPTVIIRSPVSQTTNYSTSVVINVTIDDTVGPIHNASYRFTNGTGTDGNSSWRPLFLYQGTNEQNNTHGSWNATLNLTAVTDGNYSIEINVTDSGFRQNTSVFTANVVFDSSIPTNITVTPAANLFRNANFTVNVNTTETISGLLNVSFRLENDTMNFAWVEANQAIATLATGRTYNATRFNLTHWDNIPLNATNGNFSIRVNVTDTAGNQNTTIALNFTIDTVVPSVSIFRPLEFQNQSGNFTVNATVTESNNNLVLWRWVNDSSGAVDGGHRSQWQNMTLGSGSTAFNATFTYLLAGLAKNQSFLDGNYTLEINATDKAGNVNATLFVRLILDATAPVAAAAPNGIQASQVINGTVLNQKLLLINLTVNDTNENVTGTFGVWNMNLGKLTTTNINGSSFRLINRSISTISNNATGMSLPTMSSGGNYTNASFNFSLVPNGVYDLNVTINDTAGNILNAVLDNITLDSVSPVVAAINTTPASVGGRGLSGTITINASVSDNLGFTPNGIRDNFTVVNVTFVNSSGINLGARMSNTSYNAGLWGVSVDTTLLADGDYNIYVNVSDASGNQNSTQSLTVTIQNGATNPAANISIVGGGISGSALTNPVANLTPMLTINTSQNSTCKYSLNTERTAYDDLSSTFSNNVSRLHFANIGALRDGSYSFYWSCRDTAGKNAPDPNNLTRELRFNVDTRNLFNVTIPGKTDNNWPNYFTAAPAGSANGWTRFTLSTSATDASSLGLVGTQGGANVTNVLDSLLDGTVAGNFSRIHAYNASTNSWTVFIVGQTGNNFINFTGQSEFWVNITATDRIELS